MVKTLFLVLLVLVGVLAGVLGADSKSSKHNDKHDDKRYEVEAYKHMGHAKQPDTPVAAAKKPMLCAVFIDISNTNSTNVLKNNMIVMKNHCEFAVVSYKCVIKAHFTVDNLAHEAGANLAMYRCVRPDGDLSKTHVSKPMLYDRLLPYLPHYERVWFLDEDIGLDRQFDANNLLRTMDCAFYPRPPPMVFQPTIYESTQDYNFANWKTFAGSNTIAAATDFVEIQVPIFNAAYLDWFIRYVVRPSGEIMRKEKTQFLCAGLDSMFCRSAKSFAKKALHGIDDSYVPCAVVAAPNTAVHHYNMKTIPKDKGDFFNSTKIQAHLLQKYFQSFMWWWFKKNAAGVYESPHWFEFEKINGSLPAECPLKDYGTIKPSASIRSEFSGAPDIIEIKCVYGDGPRRKRGKRRPNKSQNALLARNRPRHSNARNERMRAAMLRNRKDHKGNVSNFDAYVQSFDRAYTVQMTKVYALHFPQFHSDTLNNRIWGQDFSDWENLISSPTENREGHQVIYPTEMGYYDLADASVRKKQAELAKAYEVDGFIYHHYFFYEEGLGATLAKPLENMLIDGEPDLPFAFHWANQRWTATWQGKGIKEHELLQEQNYPDSSSPLVVEHYNWLKRFFHHKNYILVNGVPLFMVFQTFDTRCHPILDKLRELAMADGFPAPGIHIPQFRVNIEHPINKDVIPLKMRNTRVTMHNFASDAYYPSNHNFKGNMVPQWCRDGGRGNETRPVYLSTLTAFDNTPRRDFSTATVWDRRWSHLGVIKSFERDLVETMYYDMCCQTPAARNAGGKFMMVNAWNEWAEGMTMEPSNLWGRQFLDSVRNAKKIVRKIRCSLPLYEMYHSDIV
jgi:hypothetical protein